MKAWILAGMITAATAPFAAASESEIECQLEETRRATQTRSSEIPAPPNANTIVRPTAAPRDEADQAQRAAPPRRRSGKPIPDAELIGPRSTL